jgi:ribosomal-protein-alanine N-acetyltransferase
VPGGRELDRIATARLSARRPEPGDLGHWQRWYTDARIDEQAWPAHLRTADQAEVALADAMAHWQRWGFGPWTVLERGEPIGRVGLRHTRLAGRPEVELAWFLDPAVWGRGYATEVAERALTVAFDQLQLDDVVSLTTPANVASLAVMTRLGFVFEGEVEHAGLPHLLHRRHR